MSIRERVARKARWRRWCAATRRRLGAAGIDLVIEGPGTPAFGRPPEIELSRDGESPPEGTRGRLVLRLGPDTHLGTGSIIEVRERDGGILEMAAGAYFQGSTRVTLLGGGVVRLRERANVRNAIIRCSGGTVELGRAARIGYGSVLHCSTSIVLHDQVGLAERCGVIDSDHTHDGSDRWFLDQPIVVGAVELGPNTFLAAGALVLRDVHVGANSVVASNTVVRAGTYPPSSLLAGTPARVLRSLRQEEVATG